MRPSSFLEPFFSFSFSFLSGLYLSLSSLVSYPFLDYSVHRFSYLSQGVKWAFRFGVTVFLSASIQCDRNWVSSFLLIFLFFLSCHLALAFAACSIFFVSGSLPLRFISHFLLSYLMRECCL